jgi:hypothetical protein
MAGIDASRWAREACTDVDELPGDPARAFRIIELGRPRDRENAATHSESVFSLGGRIPATSSRRTVNFSR